MVFGPLWKPFQLLNVSLSVYHSLLYKLKVLCGMLRWLENLIECLQWRWNTNLFAAEFLARVQKMQLLSTHWVWYEGLFISIWELTEALWLASTLWWISFSPLERKRTINWLIHSFINWLNEWVNEWTNKIFIVMKLRFLKFRISPCYDWPQTLTHLRRGHESEA